MYTLSRTYHSTLNMVGALINIESMSEMNEPRIAFFLFIHGSIGKRKYLFYP